MHTTCTPLPLAEGRRVRMPVADLSSLDKIKVVRSTTDPVVLTELASDLSNHVLRAVAWSPHTPIGVADRFADHDDSRIRGAVASRRDRTAAQRAAAAADPDAEVAVGVAANPLMCADLLTVLAGHADERVRGAAARHPLIRPEALAALADDTSPYIRRLVAEAESTPAPVRAALATDPDQQVRDAAARPPSAPHAPAKGLRVWPEGTARFTAPRNIIIGGLSSVARLHLTVLPAINQALEDSPPDPTLDTTVAALLATDAFAGQTVADLLDCAAAIR